MCCSRLHFSDFIVLFCKKNKKNLLQFTFEKNNSLCKKREKKLVARKKPSPPGYQMVRTNRGRYSANHNLTGYLTCTCVTEPVQDVREVFGK